MGRSNSFYNLDILVLSILKKKECYGYEIVKMINEISEGNFSIKEGTLYPIIYNLLNKGMIEDREEAFKRRVRVYYRINQKGLDYLETQVKEFKKIMNGVYMIINYGEESN